MSSYAASSGLGGAVSGAALGATIGGIGGATRSEEHTSELQSLV